MGSVFVFSFCLMLRSNSIQIFFSFFLTLQYCIGFAIYQNEYATGIHVFPILNPPPSSLPITSLWVVPVHQPRASSIVHRTWTGNSFHIWYYSCFNAILPNHPTLSLSHRVQKTVLYISISLLKFSYQGFLCFQWSRYECVFHCLFHTFYKTVLLHRKQYMKKCFTTYSMNSMLFKVSRLWHAY